MTADEAIKQFEERLQIPDYKTKIPKYYEAMELAVEVLEKQVPKKPKRIIPIHSQYECAYCGNELEVNSFNGQYCHWCGQKLDFGE